MDKPSNAPNPGDKRSGGNAVDGLTPPPNYSGDGTPGSEQTEIPSKVPVAPLPRGEDRTQIGHVPTLGGKAPAQETSPSSGPTVLPAGYSKGNVPTLHPDIVVQDLSGERLLKDVPRIPSKLDGRIYPTLKTIPLLSKLGGGGMGAIYYGIHPRLNSEVAVKVLLFHLAEQDPGSIQRFFREAQIATKLRSPHLVTVTDVDEESGLFFIVMEYVAGLDAQKYLKQQTDKGQTGLPEAEVLDISIAAATGLVAAHTSQPAIVHRDLKPANIMIPYKSRANKTFDLRSAKLTDLGLARSEEGSSVSLTGVQAAMGTPGYMAPEQALDAKTADKRSDVFGMGATMYALLAGKAPFRGDAVMRVLMATMHEPHEPIRKIRPDVSQAFSDILDKCLSKAQENRYADGEQLLRALKICRRQITQGGVGDDDDDRADDPLDKTISKPVGGRGGAPTMVMPGRAAKSRAKGIALIAGAAVVLLAGGAAYFAMKPGPGVKLPESGTRIPSAAQLPEQEKSYYKRTHNNMLAEVKTNLDGDKLFDARMSLKMAKDMLHPSLLDDPELKDKEAEAQGLIDTYVQKQEFKKAIIEVDSQIAKGDYVQANTLLKSARPTPDDMAQLTKKQTEIFGYIKETEKRAQYEKLLADARNPERSPAEALSYVTEALKLYPDGEDAKDLQKKLERDNEDAKKKLEYQALLNQAADQDKLGDLAADQNKQSYYDKALALVKQASGLIPGAPEAAKMYDEISQKFDKSERDKLERMKKEQRQQDFTAALTLAKDQYSSRSYDDALASVNKALALFPDDPGAKSVKVQIEDGIKEQNRLAEVQKNKKRAGELLEQAASFLKLDRDLDEALNKVKEAKKLNPEEKTTLEQQITDRKEVLRIRSEYDNLVDEAGQMVLKNNLDPASDNVDKALDLVNKSKFQDALKALTANASSATSMRTRIAEAKAKASAAAAATRERQQKYIQYLTEAESLEKSGNDTAALENLNLAVKLLPNFGEAETKAKALQDKIAIKEKAAKQKAFADKLALADSQAKNGDYETAIATAESARSILNDAASVEQVNKKKEQYRVEQQGIETSTGAAVSQALTHLKNRSLAQALQTATEAGAKFPRHPRITLLIKTLKDLNQAENDARAAAAADDQKLANLEAPLAGRGRAERASYDSARAKLLTLPSGAMDLLGASGIIKADTILDQLRREQRQYLAEMDRQLGALQAIANTPISRPPPPPEPDPVMDGQRPPTRSVPEPRPPKAPRRSGENDIDN